MKVAGKTSWVRVLTPQFSDYNYWPRLARKGEIPYELSHYHPMNLIPSLTKAVKGKVTSEEVGQDCTNCKQDA